MINIKCYFSIHDIHKNTQRIFSDNYNNEERTRIVLSHADLYDNESNKIIGKIFEETTKFMDETHTTLLKFYLYFEDLGKIQISETFFLNDKQPFHTNFEFEVINKSNFKDTLNKNLFFGKNLRIFYKNIYSDFKGIIEISEI